MHPLINKISKKFSQYLPKNNNSEEGVSSASNKNNKTCQANLALTPSEHNQTQQKSISNYQPQPRNALASLKNSKKEASLPNKTDITNLPSEIQIMILERIKDLHEPTMPITTLHSLMKVNEAFRTMVIGFLSNNRERYFIALEEAKSSKKFEKYKINMGKTKNDIEPLMEKIKLKEDNLSFTKNINL